jgi:3-phenylpropionate/trans-cinnamate dioxygenase ferredoxin subunit
MSEFLSVATTDEIQRGERMIFEIDHTWVAVFNVKGNYYAIEDRCTHDDGPLAEGKLFDCEIECPRHGARFDLATGRVTAAPAIIPIAVYPVRVEGNEIQIQFP